jgi:hypothetical protein
MAHSSRVRELKRSKSGSGTNIVSTKQEDENHKIDPDKEEEDLAKLSLNELREKLKVSFIDVLFWYQTFLFPKFLVLVCQFDEQLIRPVLA